MTSIRNSSNKYHMPVAETGDFHALIDNEQPTKKKTRSVWKTTGRSDDYTTRNLLDYPFFSKTL